MVCMVADNGMDAVKLVETNHYDVILMDIHMPGISGIEATQKIRDFNKQVPIIALTAADIAEVTAEFSSIGFNDIITKPFDNFQFYQKAYDLAKHQRALEMSVLLPSFQA